MPSAIATIIGDANANSYATEAEADTYFDDKVGGSTWIDGDSDDKIRALLQAAKRLDQFNWLGARATSTQALAWPRIGVMKRDSANVGYAGYGYYGNYPYGLFGEQYAQDEIPQQIKDAQCEFAFAYLSGTYNDSGEAEVKSFSDDKMSVTFDQPRLAGESPAEVTRLLAGLTAQNRRVRG